MYPEAATHPANPIIRGSQSTLVVAGGGTVVEMDGLVPSTVILVDHALSRTFDKGALGTVVIEGAPARAVPVARRPDRRPTARRAASDGGRRPGDDPQNGVFDPSNADKAYDPRTSRSPSAPR